MLTGGDLVGRALRPTVMGGVAAEARLSCEEVFGPVVTVVPVEDLWEGIRRANASRFGLQAGLFTESLRSALAAVEALEFGAVLVNEVPTFRADNQPYGGLKDSGNTREGPRYAIREMTEERLAILDGSLPSR